MGRNAVHSSTPENTGGVTDERAVSFDCWWLKWSRRRGSSTKKAFILFEFERPDSKFVLTERLADLAMLDHIVC
jgi:hypothetical protein